VNGKQLFIQSYFQPKGADDVCMGLDPEDPVGSEDDSDSTCEVRVSCAQSGRGSLTRMF
jgi:hypothetical protein